MKGFIECNYCGEIFVKGEPFCPYCGKDADQIEKEQAEAEKENNKKKKGFLD